MQRVSHVLPGCQVWEERVLLEHIADVTQARRHVHLWAGIWMAEQGLAVEDNLPAIGGEQSCDRVQGCSLARARRPEQDYDLAAQLELYV